MPTQELKYERYGITIASGESYSSSFTIPPWAIFVGVYLPSMTDGSIGLEISTDGVNFDPVLDPVDGQDAIVCAAGSDAGYVDISDWVRFVPPDVYVRLTCAAQASEVNPIIFVRG